MATTTTSNAGRKITEVNGFPKAGGEVLGEILSWNAEGLRVPFATLVDALIEEGLDSTIAREMLPRNAFARACKHLVENRIIRKVDEDQDGIRFQFTAEVNVGGELAYAKQAILSLNKTTGRIECDDSDLAAQARIKFDEAMGIRTPGDITRTIQRLFEDKRRYDLDLVPLRPQGGVYFVRREYLDYVDRVEKFVLRIGASIMRLPIAAGTENGNKSVATAIDTMLENMVDDLRKAADEFNPESTPKEIEAAALKVRTLRHKIESYSEYLGEMQEQCQTHLADVVATIKAKVSGATA